MPTITLEESELEQWTIGQPNLIANMLNNAFFLLQHTTTKLVTKNSKEMHLVGSFDATPCYFKIWDNIHKIFTPKGDLSLKSSQKRDGQFLDYSALLGAYLRSDTKDKEGNPLVILTTEQLQSVEDFLKPLMNAQESKQSVQEYLETLPGSPAQKHKAILKALIFQGISQSDMDKMFKEEDKAAVDAFLDSLLSMAEFMRTPFSVLFMESEFNKKVSAPDLQFQSVCKAVKQSIKDLMPKKSKEETSLVDSIKKLLPEKNDDAIKDLAKNFELDIQKCQGSFGISNVLFESKIKVQKLKKTIASLQVESKEEPTSLKKPSQDQTDQKLIVEMGKVRQEYEALKGQLSAEKAINIKAQAEIKAQKIQLDALTRENEQLKKVPPHAQSKGSPKVASSSIQTVKASIDTKAPLVQDQQQLDQLQALNKTIAELKKELADKDKPLQEDPEKVEKRKILKNYLKELNEEASDKLLKNYCLDQLEQLVQKDILELKPLILEVKSLLDLTKAVNQIVTTLTDGERWYTRRRLAKAEEIKITLAAIPVENRLDLIKSPLRGEKDEKSPINNFLKALSHQRSLIFKSKESTSSTLFYKAIHDIKDQNQKNVADIPLQTNKKV